MPIRSRVLRSADDCSGQGHPSQREGNGAHGCRFNDIWGFGDDNYFYVRHDDNDDNFRDERWDDYDHYDVSFAKIELCSAGLSLILSRSGMTMTTTMSSSTSTSMSRAERTSPKGGMKVVVAVSGSALIGFIYALL